MIAHQNKIVGEGLTYDDVLLVPAYSEVLPREVNIQSKFSRNIILNTPIVSAAMDTVTSSKMAIAIAQEEKEKQKIISYASGGGVLMLAGIMLILVRASKRRKESMAIISNQRNEVAKQNQQLEAQKGHLEEQHKEITDSITYAKRIQQAILPTAKSIRESLKESFVLYKPKDVIAGDFYWLEPCTEESNSEIILFAAADCTGHGVPGAMVSVVCNNALNRSVREYGITDPGLILDKTREIVIQEFEKSEEDVKDGMDIALCALEGNILKYAGANNPLWIIRGEEIIEIKADKQPIGKFDHQTPFTTHEIKVQKGDVIYIFSDGYVDQFGGEKGKKFRSRAFKTLLLGINNKTMEEKWLKIDEAFENWKGNLEQIDDVCVFGVQV